MICWLVPDEQADKSTPKIKISVFTIPKQIFNCIRKLQEFLNVHVDVDARSSCQRVNSIVGNVVIPISGHKVFAKGMKEFMRNKTKEVSIPYRKHLDRQCVCPDVKDFFKFNIDVFIA